MLINLETIRRQQTKVSQMVKHIKKSTKGLTKIVCFKQFRELYRISHGADVVGQSVPGGRTRM